MFLLALILLVAFADDQPRAVVCESVRGFEYCEVKIASYPEPIAVISPKNAAQSVKIHFHGYLVNPQSNYDRSIRSYIETLSLFPSSLSERVIIPRSRGQCDTYAKHIPDFKKFLSDLGKWIPDDAPIELSAHSGAGEFLGNWISKSEIENVRGVHFIDAIYSQKTADQVIAWGKNHSDDPVTVGYVRGSRTELHSKKVVAAIGSNSGFKVFMQYKLPPGVTESHHYFILRRLWPLL